MVGHGAVSLRAPDPDNPAIIDVDAALQAIQEQRFHYLALGDRHSTTNVTGQAEGRIWYSGTPEAFDFVEIDNGNVLLVEAAETGVRVAPKRVGTWRFLVCDAALDTQHDLDMLALRIEEIPNKAKTLLKLGLTGTLTMAQSMALDELKDHWSDLFAAVVMSTSRSDLAVVASSDDFSQLHLSGYGAKTLEMLRDKTVIVGPDQESASDALALLFRLQGPAT
jgi:DNA repair exonuclease SbcCD nuclease subunit